MPIVSRPVEYAPLQIFRLFPPDRHSNASAVTGGEDWHQPANQNANLGALAKDKVWLSCTIILPLRAQGDAGSPVRPVAIGAPSQ